MNDCVGNQKRKSYNDHKYLKSKSKFIFSVIYRVQRIVILDGFENQWKLSFHLERLFLKLSAGPHAKHMSKEDRQRALQEQYFFTCSCDACKLATGDEMETCDWSNAYK